MPTFSVLEQFSVTALVLLGTLGILSACAMTVVLAKLMQFHGERIGSRRETDYAMQLLRSGDRASAFAFAKAGRGLRARALAAAIDPAARPDAARLAAVRVAMDGLGDLTRFIRVLEAVVQAAPMLGLLGTVVGMIEAFAALAATTGAADPAVLAGGIWTALLTTAIGLSVAIVFYFFSLWFETRIANERSAIDSILMEALALVTAR